MKLKATITYYLKDDYKKYVFYDIYNMHNFYNQEHALNYIKYDLYSVVAYDKKIKFFDIKIEEVKKHERV